MWVYRCIIPVCTLEQKQISSGYVVDVIDCDRDYSDRSISGDKDGIYVISFKFLGDEFSVPVEVFSACFRRQSNG